MKQQQRHILATLFRFDCKTDVIHFLFFIRTSFFFQRLHVLIFQAKLSLQCSQSVLNSRKQISYSKPFNSPLILEINVFSLIIAKIDTKLLSQGIFFWYLCQKQQNFIANLLISSISSIFQKFLLLAKNFLLEFEAFICS